MNELQLNQFLTNSAVIEDGWDAPTLPALSEATAQAFDNLEEPKSLGEVEINNAMVLAGSLFSTRLDKHLTDQDRNTGNHTQSKLGGKNHTAESTVSDVLPVSNPEDDLSLDVRNKVKVLCEKLEKKNYYFPSTLILDAIFMYADELHNIVIERFPKITFCSSRTFLRSLSAFQSTLISTKRRNIYANLCESIKRTCFSFGDEIANSRGLKDHVLKDLNRKKLNAQSKAKLTLEISELNDLFELLNQLIETEAGLMFLSKECHPNFFGELNLELKDLVPLLIQRLDIFNNFISPEFMQHDVNGLDASDADKSAAIQIYERYHNFFLDNARVIKAAIAAKNKGDLHAADRAFKEKMSQFRIESYNSSIVHHINRDIFSIYENSVELEQILGTVVLAVELGSSFPDAYKHLLRLSEYLDVLSDFFTLIDWSKCISKRANEDPLQKIVIICNDYSTKWKEKNLTEQLQELVQSKAPFNIINCYKCLTEILQTNSVLYQIEKEIKRVDMDENSAKFLSVFEAGIDTVMSAVKQGWTEWQEEGARTVETSVSSRGTKRGGKNARGRAKNRNTPRAQAETKKEAVTASLAQPTESDTKAKALFETEEELSTFVGEMLISEPVLVGEAEQPTPTVTKVPKNTPKAQAPKSANKKSKPSAVKAKENPSVESRTHKNAAPIVDFSGRARKVDRVIKVLTDSNFHLIKQNGSHAKMHNAQTNETITLPIHPGKPICRRAQKRINDMLSKQG